MGSMQTYPEAIPFIYSRMFFDITLLTGFLEIRYNALCYPELVESDSTIFLPHKAAAVSSSAKLKRKMRQKLPFYYSSLSVNLMNILHFENNHCVILFF